MEEHIIWCCLSFSVTWLIHNFDKTSIATKHCYKYCYQTSIGTKPFLSILKDWLGRAWCNFQSLGSLLMWIKAGQGLPVAAAGAGYGVFGYMWFHLSYLSLFFGRRLNIN